MSGCCRRHGLLAPGYGHAGEIDAKDFERCRIVEQSEKHPAAAGDEQASSALVVLPQMTCHGPRTDNLGDVVVPEDSPVLIEKETLPRRVRVRAGRKRDVETEKAGALTKTHEPCVSKRERERVVVPHRIAEEIERIEWIPLAPFLDPRKRAPVIAALCDRLAARDILDHDVAVQEPAAVQRVGVRVKDRLLVVRTHFELV